MNYDVVFERKALEDIRQMIHSGKKSDVKKLDLILEELKLQPAKGIGCPEKTQT